MGSKEIARKCSILYRLRRVLATSSIRLVKQINIYSSRSSGVQSINRMNTMKLILLKSMTTMKESGLLVEQQTKMVA